MKYFEDFEIGVETIGTTTYSVTEEEVVAIARKWDPQPFHIDHRAADASIFGGLVASSVHVFAISVLLGEQNHGPMAAVSALGFDKMRLHAPIRPGDVLSYRDKCVAKRPSRSRPGCGIMQFEVKLSNQHGHVVFSRVDTALIKFREQSSG